MQIVHAIPVLGHLLIRAGAVHNPEIVEAQHAAAQSIVDTAAAAVRNDHPGLEVTTTVLEESIDDAMKMMSRHARLLVVGCDDVSPAEALLVGSLTLDLAAHANCPVAAWRGEALDPTRQPIVIGVDLAGGGAAALELAFVLADALEAPVRAVHAWSMRVPPGEDSVPLLIDWTALETLLTEEITRALEPHRQRHPGVEVSIHVDLSSPRRALLQHASDAQMVIVGSRGRARLATVLGSTSLNMLHHAPVPVLVCPPEPDDG